MRSPDRKRLLLAWTVLVAVTLAYLWIDDAGERHGARVASTAVTVSAIALAIVKFRVILREFMDVRGAPPLLRRLTDVLAGLIAVALVTTYCVGRAVA